MIASISTSLENYFRNLLLNNMYLPANFSYVFLLGLMLLSVALIFMGSKTWAILFAALGAYYGYIFSSFILHYIPLANTPTYLVLLIGVVVGAVLMSVFVKIALSAGSGLLAFVILVGIYPSYLPEILVICVMIFALIFFLYKRVTLVVAGIMGAFLLWFVLIVLGLTSLEAQIVAGILYPLGLYLQLVERSRKKENYRRSRRIPQYYNDYRYRY